VSGFPYERHRIRERFRKVLEETGWKREEGDLRLLCLHHCVEGATVGPGDYTFRNARDVIRCSDLPQEFAAVLSGHIHRHQILRVDLDGKPLSTPVLYPGSVERTAFAEVGEEKGFMVLELQPDSGGGRLVHHSVRPLPTRPMILRDLHPKAGQGAPWLPQDLDAQLNATLAGVPKDAVLRIRIHGPVPVDLRTALAAARLRELASPEMNLEVILTADRAERQAGHRKGLQLSQGSEDEEARRSNLPPQLEMNLPGLTLP
jgi:hypothetical protein